MSHNGSQFDFEDLPSVHSFSEYGRPEEEHTDPYQKRLDLKHAIDAAVDAGASTHIDIPQVVVIGSQSSGKSSLFEGISGVPLPRNTSTCTRCPIICRMANKPGPWRCRIGIIREVDENGDSLPVPKHIPFGPDIDSVSNVRERIERAQIAILHPQQDSSEFLNAGVVERAEGGFSFDSIVVDISGPDVVDLSFVDLPGIIADDGDGNNSVRRVQDMASKYIARESSLILLVFHCSDDIQNQGAGRLARKHDREGKRTITVMTKPDMIEPIQAEPWRAMLRASEHCFCVRQPGASQLHTMSQVKARQQEMEFFQEDPWSNEYNDPSTQHRLGTENLTNYLNVRLLDWIVAKLPEMQEDLRQHLFDTQDTLDRLPVEVDDPVKLANELIWKFSERLKATVNIYNFKIPLLVGTCRRRLEQFTDILFYRLPPQFRPFPKAMQGRRKSFDGFPKTLPQPPALSAHVAAVAVPSTVYLDEVMEGCEIGRTREMPGNYPYGIQKEYMEASVKVWRNHTEMMLDDIFQYISKDLKTLVFDHFASVGRGASVWGVVESHIKLRRDNVRKTLLDSLEREKTCSLVYSCSEYLHYRDIYHELYRSQHPMVKRGLPASAIIHGVADVFPDPVVSTIGHKVANLMEKEEIDEDRLPTEEEHGIRIMAETRAFYHVAVRRYAEGTAQIVFHDLLLDIQGGSELEQKLRERVGISGPDAVNQCRTFVEPSRDTIRERNALGRKKELLRNILSRFSNFF